MTLPKCPTRVCYDASLFFNRSLGDENIRHVGVLHGFSLLPHIHMAILPTCGSILGWKQGRGNEIWSLSIADQLCRGGTVLRLCARKRECPELRRDVHEK